MNEQLKIIISAEIDKLKKGVEEAKKQAESFKKQYEQAAKNVDDNFASMGESIKSTMKNASLAVAGVATALLALGASTQEYRNEQAKLNAAFETAGASAETAKTTYNDLYRVLGDSGQATEAASHLAKLTTEEKALSEWTNICQGVYASFGDSLAIEGLTEAVNHTAKLGEVQGSLADALEWSGVNVDTFNEQLAAAGGEAEREKLIRETLNGLYSEAASNYETTAAEVLAQNEAQAQLQDTTAKLGEVVAPLITSFTQFATNALAVVVPYIQQLAEQYGPALNEVLGTTSEVLGTVMGFLVDNWEIVLGVAGVIGGIAAAIGLYNTVAAVKAAMAALEVTSVWGLVAAYTAQAAAMVVALAPYLLIVAAIAAVIAIIVLCIKHWDDIKEAVSKAFEKIKETVQKGIEAVVGFFNKIINFVKENWQGLLLLIVNPFAGAFKLAYDNCEGFRNKVNAVFTKIKDGIKNTLTAAKDIVVGIFDKIKSGITDRINGAKDAVSKVINTIKGFFDFKFKLPDIPKPSFGISPSGWKVGDLLKGSIPKLSIKWNAVGGVFDKPTVFNYGDSLQGIGEDGAEAVVPLEKNTQWLDRLATMLNEKQGTTPIVLQVDGKTFAQISVDSINQLTKQTGSLPLKLA